MWGENLGDIARELSHAPRFIAYEKALEAFVKN